jgi:hypothetical protein
MAYTDFDYLANLTTDKTPESALPCNLADDVLQLISNDLKQVALCRTKTVDQYPRRVRTVHLLSRLMLAQSERITGDDRFVMPLVRIDFWMELFQYYVEREILCRANGTSSKADTEELLNDLENEVEISTYLNVMWEINRSESSRSGSGPRG